MRKANKKQVRRANKDSRIKTIKFMDVVETSTSRRDPGSFDAMIESMNHGRGESRVFLYPRERNGEFQPPVMLDGYEARTLYTLLQKHYASTGRTW